MTAWHRRDWAALAAGLAFWGFVGSILLGLLLPLYTDEVTWRMQLRAGIDDGFDRMLTDSCGPNTIAAPVWFMWPHRSVSAWLNLAFADPLYVRLLGLGCALAWAFVLRAMIARLSENPRQRAILTALAFGLLGLGVLPIMMVMNRPDQLVLLCVTAAIAVTVGSSQAKRGWPALVAVLALGVLAISVHLKGLLFAPLFLLCLFFAGRSRISLPLRLALMLGFAALSAQAAGYWSARFQCPDDPVLAGDLAKQNLASKLAQGAPISQLAGEALQGASPNGYLAIAEARKAPMSNWLPFGRIDNNGNAVRAGLMLLAWNWALLLALYCVFQGLRQCCQERRLDFAALAAPAIAGLILVWGASQLVKNDYEAAVVLPMLAISIALALAASPWSEGRARLLGPAVIGLVAMSLVAQIDIARRYAPPLIEAARHPGYVKGQDVSVSTFGYGSIRERIRATARQCGIGAKGRAIKPLTDDVTYFAMMDSYRPFHQLGVIGTWRGKITDPGAFLKAQGSEGAILGCHLLPPEWRGRARRNGQFCCVEAQ